MSTIDWHDVAGKFSIPPEVTYLNNGSYGPVPTDAIEATVERFRKLEANPQEFINVYRGQAVQSKKVLGAFLGMKPEDFVFITNVTVGMNMVAAGLRGLTPGDEIVSTDQEYGAVDNAWKFAANRQGLDIVRAHLPAPAERLEDIYDAVVSKFGPKTKALYLSHITSPTGVILPVREICAEARRRGILSVIDGAHAPGMVPLDVESLGADVYVGNCHKWLCAPKGVAFLWARQPVQHLLAPFIVGWGWVEGKETFIGNFENPGTHNPTGYIAVETCIALQESIGRDVVAARGRELAAYGRRRVLEEIPGAAPRTPGSADMSNSLQAFNLPKLPDVDFPQLMREHNIVVVIGQDEEAVRLRISTHIYNSEADIDTFIDVLREAYGRS